MTKKASDTLHGGRVVTVQRIAGGSEQIEVRQVRMSELRAYRERERDEFARLEFVTGLKAADLDALLPASFEALLEADGEVNGPLARRQETREATAQARDLAQMAASMPGVYQKAEEQVVALLVATMTPAADSSDSSHESSPAAD